MTMHPGVLTVALTHYDIAAGKGTTATEIAAARKLAQAVREYQAEQAGTWTVIGVWNEDEAIVTGTIQGTHAVYGGDNYDAFPQGCWATSVTAPDADTAEDLAVDEMTATLREDNEDDAEPDTEPDAGFGGQDITYERNLPLPEPGATANDSPDRRHARRLAHAHPRPAPERPHPGRSPRHRRPDARALRRRAGPPGRSHHLRGPAGRRRRARQDPGSTGRRDDHHSQDGRNRQRGR